ncbi:MAG: polyamine aminopropyltransferase [Candidatus Cloacimonadaceae bacterium]
MPYWFTEKHTPTRGLTFQVEQNLYQEKSPYQILDIVETKDFGLVMLLDGVIMVTEKDEFVYHEMLAHPALFTHPRPEQVLIIGGGDGGTLKQVLRHPGVKKAVLVEIDEMVVNASKRFFPHLAEAFDDPRTEVLIEDGIAYLKSKTDEFDVILIDSTDPVGPAEGLFHKEFYADCCKALKEDGILTIQSESPWIPDLQTVISKAHVDLEDLFPIVMPYIAAIQTYQAGLWLFQLASKKYHPLTDFCHKRLSGFDFKYYNEDLHKGCFALPQFVKELLR